MDQMDNRLLGLEYNESILEYSENEKDNKIHSYT